jgi:hypothetical protein
MRSFSHVRGSPLPDPVRIDTDNPSDAPTLDCAGAMARVKATLLRRRFAALTRAMRSRSGHLSERQAEVEPHGGV